MIVHCPHCGNGHSILYQPGPRRPSQRCGVCGKGFAFFPALEIESLGLPRDGSGVEPIPLLQVPIRRNSGATEQPALPRIALAREPGVGNNRSLPHAGARPLRFGGLAIGIALIAALVVQFLIHERATLAEHPELLALSTALCRQLPCPDARGHVPGTIRVDGLHLDPQAPGRLRVDMRVSNTLDRPQTWPSLEMTLSDRFGRTLAKGRWEPREYLGPDDASGTLEPGEVRRLRLLIDQPAGGVEGISVRAL
jgi:hypothetical protein